MQREVEVVATFKIPSGKAAKNKTIRFSDALIAQVEEAIRETDCTFSAFVVAAVRHALAELEEGKKPGI